MDFEEFAVNYPELYAMIDEDVRNAIEMYQITGDESLRDWDDLVEYLVIKYEQQLPYEDTTEENTAQQYPYGYRGRDRDNRRRRRRRFRNFDLRDIIRLSFLRRLFDRNRY